MRGVWNWIVTRTADYGLPKQIELIDIVQILLIAFFVYHLIRWLQNTKAYTLMKGIFLIGVFVIIANVLKMQRAACRQDHRQPERQMAREARMRAVLKGVPAHPSAQSEDIETRAPAEPAPQDPRLPCEVQSSGR